MNVIILDGRVIDPSQNINKKINIEIKTVKLITTLQGSQKKT